LFHQPNEIDQVEFCIKLSQRLEIEQNFEWINGEAANVDKSGFYFVLSNSPKTSKRWSENSW
jgi:hypothetical protein